MDNVFVKRAPSAEIRTEAASLRWLAAADAMAVVPLVEVNAAAGYLTTQRIESTPVSAQMAYEAGAQLAATHAFGAPHFGAGPPTLSGEAHYAGLHLPLSTTPMAWGEFYAQLRLAPYLRLARDRGAISAAQVKVCEAAFGRIAAGEFTSELPSLCRERNVSAALTHGDLWGGNILWGRLANSEHACGWLIDPAAHGGHAETDLGALALFGSAHLSDMIAGYQSVSRLAAGWQQRVGLHQLHMLLVHAALFGGGYGAQASAICAKLC